MVADTETGWHIKGSKLPCRLTGAALLVWIRAYDPYNRLAAYDTKLGTFAQGDGGRSLTLPEPNKSPPPPPPPRKSKSCFRPHVGLRGFRIHVRIFHGVWLTIYSHGLQAFQGSFRALCASNFGIRPCHCGQAGAGRERFIAAGRARVAAGLAISELSY